MLYSSTGIDEVATRKSRQGSDGSVRVATVRTATGIYKRPVVKLALLLPSDEVG